MSPITWSGLVLGADVGARVEPAGTFDDLELDGMPEPVRRYFLASIDPGTRLASSARLRMRGSIKIGALWLKFRADQLLAPRYGFVWDAHVGGILAGSDRYAGGRGAMGWKLLGSLRVLHADGPDVSKSSAGRAGAEAMWLPTAMLPRFGVSWSATDDDHICASYRLDDTDLELRYTLGSDSLVKAIALDRWRSGDKERPARPCRFVHEALDYSSLEGLTIPTRGRAAWFDGTDDWRAGEFFRYDISAFELIE
jgi:hypothetical protein